MKVLQFLGLLEDSQPIAITPDYELDWNDENPYMLHPEKVQDLKWYFVRTVEGREVTQIRTNAKENDGMTLAYLSIVYK